MKKLMFYWLLLVCVVSFVCIACYSTAQQLDRQSAADVPAQLVRDAGAALEGGAQPASIVMGVKTDISRSLSPFLIIYDANKKAVASSASLDGSAPTLPSGLLDNIPQTGDSRVTWQPRRGLRFATVTMRYKGGFIVAGQSLYESEMRTGKIGSLILIGWIAGVIGSFAVVMILGAAFGYIKKAGSKEQVQ